MSDTRVHPCLIHPEGQAPVYLALRAVEGVIAPGRRVEVHDNGGTYRAVVAEPWPHQLGSVVCLTLLCGTCEAPATNFARDFNRHEPRGADVADFSPKGSMKCGCDRHPTVSIEHLTSEPRPTP